MPAYSLFADHYQFYLFDELALPPYPEGITDTDVQRQFKAVPNLIAVYTDDAAECEVTIECCEGPPQLDLEDWAHVVEGPLSIPCGRVVLASPSSALREAPRIVVLPGAYRVRVASCGIGPSALRYSVWLWPSTVAGVEVLKQATPHAA